MEQQRVVRTWARLQGEVRRELWRGDPLPLDLRILSVCCHGPHGNLKVSLIVESRGRRQTRSTELSRPLARAALVIQWRIDIVRPFWPSGSLGLISSSVLGTGRAQHSKDWMALHDPEIAPSPLHLQACNAVSSFRWHQFQVFLEPTRSFVPPSKPSRP